MSLSFAVIYFLMGATSLDLVLDNVYCGSALNAFSDGHVSVFNVTGVLHLVLGVSVKLVKY